MLLERWQAVVRDRPHRRALTDLPAGRFWTFSELDAAARSLPRAPQESLVYPGGMGLGFILHVLRAWHSRAIVCPVEVGQTAPAFPPPPPGIVHLKTTSATSGTARGVGFTASQLAADVSNIVQIMGLDETIPNLGTISLAHSYGFSNLVLPLLLHGIPLILVGSSLPEAVRQALAVSGPVTLAGVPALWRAWFEAGVLGPSIRTAISAGAPLPLELEHQVHSACALKIHNFYGASECGGIAYDDSPLPRTEEALIGRPPPAVGLQRDDLGRLTVSGPAVGQGYWPEPSPALDAGCFRSSDLVRLKHGQVYLEGRADDVIHVAGRKVLPEVIESALSSHPAVRQCLVFGVEAADRTRNQSIVACVVVHGPHHEDDLRAHLAHRLPSWQWPRDWWFVDSLQVNARGKISRAFWRAQYLRSSHR